jgi:hypothetical protein
MKVHVTGVETVEVTDPKGVCKDALMQPAPVGQPAVPGPGTVPWQVSPTPMIPTPITPMPSNPFNPGTTGSPHFPTKWEKKIDCSYPISVARPMTQAEVDEKWGKGLAGQTEPQKWIENWQAKMEAAGENTHTE